MTNTECRNLAKRSLTEIGIILMFLISATPALTAQIFSTLADFDGKSNGANPAWGLLAQGIDGNIYGTTHLGGIDIDLGSIFKVTPSGTLTSLHSFTSIFTGNPYGGLVLATDGNFYGTTASLQGGMVYQMTPGGVVTTIFYFCTPPYSGGTKCADGKLPADTLVLGINGNFYGMTPEGGANNNGGTVFEVTREGRLTTLYSFCAQPNCADGNYPISTLVQGNDGNFYGSTNYGGANGNYGTIFKITPAGQLTTLHSFSGTDGSVPAGTLIQATDGYFYGVTYNGGPQGDGTIFKISAGGAFKPLYNFCAQTNCTDGANPSGGLVQATDGNFYGTTSAGGASGSYGTVFQLTPDGTLTTLHAFDNSDGSDAEGSLLQATNGILYGTTYFGGPACSGFTDGCGTLFSVALGLGPFVKSVTAAGRVGAEVGILGNDLTGATQVTFNGTAAQFTVQSPTLVITHVPAGATTGTIQVTLPGGTLSSNAPFHVIQ
jgi:uncharacterized repeat protein (TIGR03803 family)